MYILPEKLIANIDKAEIIKATKIPYLLPFLFDILANVKLDKQAPKKKNDIGDPHSSYPQYNSNSSFIDL